MTQAATFGRRGTVAVPPAGRANQPRPAARASAPATVSPTAVAKADPKPAGDSLPGYFLWLLFSFDRRLDRRTYRYARIVANLGFVVAIGCLNSELRKVVPAQSPALALCLALLIFAVLGLMSWTTLAMQVKRRHDRDKAWWWLFVGFIPIAGPLWVLVETCWLDGTPGYNRFDDPAKSAAAVF
ncbi:MAG TPA: DUF805 domain-containing protein [Caulobacteraceae bacterium]|nr:DUF805 domain-containing protein [Caulobacteraceae bacterium]